MSSPAVPTPHAPCIPTPSGARRPVPRGRRRPPVLRSASIGVLGSALLLVGVTAGAPTASAAQPTVGLGTAAAFTVLGGSAVTNTGPSTLWGELGVSPGTSITGFPPGLAGGATHQADAVALQAQADVTTAYDDAAGRTPVVTDSTLGGQSLAPGVYKSSSALSLTGTVTLNGEGDPSSVFIFQAGSTLITATDATVALIGDAQPCNVFWQVGSSATLGTTTTFVGTILALTSASLDTGATVAGRVFARNGAVTLDDNVFTRPGCSTASTTVTTTATTTAGGTTTATGGTTGATGTGGTGTTASGAGSAGTGVTGTGTAASSGTAAGTSSAVVPVGSPATGFGGAARPDGSPLLIGAGSALIASGAALALVARRRRTVAVRAGTGTTPTGS